MITEQMTQELSVACAPLFPASVTFDNTNAVVVPGSGVDAIDMLKFGRIMGIVSLGVGTPNNGTAKIYAWWTGTATNNGALVAFTTNTNGTLNTNNTTLTMELRADQLPAGNRYVKLNILVPVANAIVGANILGEAGPYKPASAFDYTTNTTLLSRIVY